VQVNSQRHKIMLLFLFLFVSFQHFCVNIMFHGILSLMVEQL